MSFFNEEMKTNINDFPTLPFLREQRDEFFNTNKSFERTAKDKRCAQYTACVL